MKRVFVTALALLACSPAVLLSETADPIAERQELMSNTREALKPMIGMIRGQADYDADVVMKGLEVMKHTAANAGELFPEGTETGGDTEAKATIWSDRAGFDKAMMDFNVAVDAAIAAAPQDVDAFKPVMNDIMGTCKGCHDGYRVDKD